MYWLLWIHVKKFTGLFFDFFSPSIELIQLVYIPFILPMFTDGYVAFLFFFLCRCRKKFVEIIFILFYFTTHTNTIHTTYRTLSNSDWWAYEKNLLSMQWIGLSFSGTLKAAIAHFSSIAVLDKPKYKCHTQVWLDRFGHCMPIDGALSLQITTFSFSLKHFFLNFI